MPKDTDYSYIHMTDPSHILFSEQWEMDKLPYDDIEIPPHFFNPTTMCSNGNNNDNLLVQFLSTPEDQENEMTMLMNGGTMMNNGFFSSAQANQRSKNKNKRLNWQELGLNEFVSRKGYIHDTTILKRPDFGSNGAESAEEFHASFDFTSQITEDDLFNDETNTAQQQSTKQRNILTDPDLANNSDYDISTTNNNSTSQRITSNQFVTPVVPNRVVYHSFAGGDSTVRRPSQQQQRRVSSTTSGVNSGNDVSDYMTTPQGSNARIIR